MRKTVRFTYHTGIARDIFDNPVLSGAWDGAGRYSTQWSDHKMDKIVGPDGCPSFSTTAEIESDDSRQVFHWGVRLDGPAGKGVWAILTEEPDPATRSEEHT